MPPMEEQEAINLMLVYSMNRWRSPTAEKVFADVPGVIVRSAGTNRNAVKTVSAFDLDWATHVLVMEHEHKQRLKRQFSEELRFKQVHVLDISDDYRFMAPDLIVQIQRAVHDLQILV